MPATRVRIEGRVQGVGFRGFVFRLAQELGLVGEVWNGADGAVGAIFQSDDKAAIERAIERLKSGPGHVDKVEILPAEESDYGGFSITFTRFNS